MLFCYVMLYIRGLIGRPTKFIRKIDIYLNIIVNHHKSYWEKELK